MLPAFELLKFKNILAIRDKGGVIGYNFEKQEVARLSEQAWQALQLKTLKTNDDQSLLNSDAQSLESETQEALSQLESWSEADLDQIKTQTLKAPQIKSITINVNQVCNLHCTYCAAGGDGSFGDPIKKISIDKTIPQLKWLLENCPEDSEFSITFIGGEPLLYPEGIKLLVDYAREKAKEKGIQLSFTVVTNGTLINDANLELLKQMQANMTISIDGPSEINDQVRPTKGGGASTEKTIVGIKKLMEQKNKLGTIGLSGVFGRHNMELLKAYEFYKDFNVDWFDFTYDHTELEATYSDSFARQLGEIARLAFEQGGESGLRKIKQFDSYFKLLDSQQKSQNYCGAGKSYLIIDSRNNLYACPWMVGQAAESIGSATSIESDKVQVYLAPLNEKTSCQQCWARSICGGGCTFMHQNKTGSKTSVDNNFCERTRYLIAQALLYYERSRVLQNERLTQ